MRYELDRDGNFVCDIVGLDGLELVAAWTLDPVPQPCRTPRYVGGAVDPVTGERYGGSWEDPVGPSEVLTEQALAEALLFSLRQECERRLSVLKRDYPESEVISWDKQEAEARAGGGPFTDALASARGIDPAELRARIIAKADAFAVLSGQIIGQRQALEDQVKAGAREVVWP